MHHSHHRDTTALFVDAVDHAVGATPGAVPIIEWWLESLANTARIVEERADDELVCREGH
jgi:hypothetical protein